MKKEACSSKMHLADDCKNQTNLDNPEESLVLRFSHFPIQGFPSLIKIYHRKGGRNTLNIQKRIFLFFYILL